MTRVPRRVLVNGECATMVRGEERVKACRGFWFLPLVLFRGYLFGLRGILIFGLWFVDLRIQSWEFRE